MFSRIQAGIAPRMSSPETTPSALGPLPRDFEPLGTPLSTRVRVQATGIGHHTQARLLFKKGEASRSSSSGKSPT